MLLQTLFPFPLLLGSAHAAETVLGLYVFHRHGDRTPKSFPPVSLTPLGYAQVFQSGAWYRENYIAANAPSRINNISPNDVKLSQIAASAPQDNVLMSAAVGFLQGLYPAVEESSRQKLRNGSTVEAPLGGYQIIPVETVASGADSENTAWLQGASNCANAVISSNEYFDTEDYKSRLHSTQAFYDSLAPVISSTIERVNNSYKNAYTIYDYINYATIHNTTIPSSPILTPPTLTLLSSLANTHEYHLAYNATSPVRAIAGATLAAEILAALNGTVTGNSSTPLFNIQLGAYGYFLSFFGLAGLTSLPPSTTSGDSFEGIPDYTSAMTFELVTNASVVTGSLPAEKDISVRFLWHNGTTSNRSTPVAYPLFGQPEMTLPWVKFVAGMSAFAVGTGEAWCGQCGGCDLSRSAVDGGQGGGGGISRAVAGVIGALVTLVVVMGVEVGVLVGAGLRVGRRKGMGEGSGEGMGKEGGG